MFFRIPQRRKLGLTATPQQKLNPTKVTPLNEGFTSRFSARQGQNTPGFQKEFAATGQRQIQTIPTLVVTNNPYRGGVIITNLDPSNTVFIGPYFVSVATGQGIPPLQSFTYPITSEIWAIAGTPLNVSFAEVAFE